MSQNWTLDYDKVNTLQQDTTRLEDLRLEAVYSLFLNPDARFLNFFDPCFPPVKTETLP